MNLGFLDKRNSMKFEMIFISFFWVLLFTAPLFFHWMNKDTINWGVIFNVWFDYLPLFIVFSINRYIIIPQFLFKSRLALHVFFVTLLITITVLGSITIRQQLNPQQKSSFHQHDLLQLPDSNKNIKQKNRRDQEPPLSSTPPYFNLILLSVLLVGFDTGMKLSVKWAQTKQQKAEIEKENIKNELAFLRNQISPHFLMNTLNNIHSLIDFDTKEAKRAIAKLSVLMRHLLHETERHTALTKEIDFISSYIELMRLRFFEGVDIRLNLPEQLPDITIPPLLFTNILENAFKYGVSYDKKSFIHIDILIDQYELEFNISNSLHINKESTEKSGIGIENTAKRLKLLYKGKHTFTYTKNEDMFSSMIKIPI